MDRRSANTEIIQQLLLQNAHADSLIALAQPLNQATVAISEAMNCYDEDLNLKNVIFEVEHQEVYEEINGQNVQNWKYWSRIRTMTSIRAKLRNLNKVAT
ncbi:unnamed protein product [Cuscuta epithymum]|uniref:Uncharacterized protein n=1 Tax=Cuscuta epithymum TaxID=186058 RepID=A0AAV0FKU1_9ASTE|nr:unnamed protein product [Cuscuta epithymum]